MTVYRKRRQSQGQRQRRRTQRGGEGPSVSALAARFGAKVGPVGSRPVSKPVSTAAVQKGFEPSVNLAAGLTHLNLPGQYGPEDSTPNIIRNENLPSLGPALPIKAVQPGSIAEEKYLEAAKKRAANANAKARQNAKQAEIDAQIAENESVMAGLNDFAANPRGAWPGVSTPTGVTTPTGAPKSFYNLSPAERKAAAAETKAGWAAGQGPYVPAPVVQPTGEFYANPNPYGTGNLTRAETNDPALIEHWKRTGVPLYPTNRRTVRHQQEVKMNPWVHGGARRKTRRSKNRKTRKARS